MNEVEETIRVLDAQIAECRKKFDEAKEALLEFSEKGTELTSFLLIQEVLMSYKSYWELQLVESKAAKKEVMDKYDIEY